MISISPMKLRDTLKEDLSGKQFRHFTLFSVLLQKPWWLQKSFIWKKWQLLQDLPLVSVVGCGTAWKTISQLLASGQTLTHSLWRMIHLGWRAGHTAARVRGGLAPRAMIFFQRGNRWRTLWDPLLTQNETQNNPQMHWKHPECFGNSIGNIHFSLILKVHTAHYMDLNT